MRNTIDGDVYIAQVPGEPASKANSRRLVAIHGSPRFIKSKKALAYSKSFALLCPARRELMEGCLVVGMKVYYKSQRPDLDESLVLDLMQDLVYKNDRQVRRKFIDHAVDKNNPRVVIYVASLERTKEAVEYILSLD